MHIVSPVPLREYNVKFTVTLFSYESDNLHKWNTDRRERYQESLIWIDFTYLLVYLLFLLLYATGLCCICSNKNTLPFPPPPRYHMNHFILLIFSCKWIDRENTYENVWAGKFLKGSISDI